MTSKLDPQELERLSKAATQGVWEISAYYTGTGPDEKCYGLVEVEDFPIGIIDEEGATAESLSPNLEFVTTLVNAYRTGQLVPAMPSGDVVEAVRKALFDLDWAGINPSEMPGEWEDAGLRATAAIATYEAVSGVAKMRDALKKTMTALSEAIEEERARINSMRGAVLERTTNRDLAAIAEWQSAVDAARAALGEKP